jgi:hypothetical protein
LPPASKIGFAALPRLRTDDLATALRRLPAFALTFLAAAFLVAFAERLIALPAIGVHSRRHSIDGETMQDRVGADGEHAEFNG